MEWIRCVGLLCEQFAVRFQICIANVVAWWSVRNPMDIINGAEPDLVQEGKMIDLLGTDDLFVIIKRDALLISVVVIIGLLITMLFIRRSEKLADRKEDIMHKLLIVFLIASLVSILNIISILVEGIFQ